MPDEKDRPDFTGAVHKRQAKAVAICRDVYAGTLRLREKGETYLPRFPRETDAGYAARLATAVLFNAYRRTVGGLAGLVFRKPPQLGDDVPQRLREDWENIDLAGRHGDVFARDAFEDELIDGHVHIFVDMQAVEPGTVRTLDDERRLGLRPYWVLIRKQDVLRFRTVDVGGRPVLTAFAYRETVTEPDGTFGEKEVERIRDYRLVQEGGRTSVVFEVFAKRRDEKGGERWVSEQTGSMAISRIPLATGYAARTGFLQSEPPLLDLALENIGHYQVRSDRRNSLHIAGVPIPVFIGLDSDDKVAVGADTGLKLPLGGDAKYLEPTGAALDASRDELQDIEQRMAALGLAMLQRQTRAAETAEAKRIDKAESDSALAAAARGLKDLLEEALGYHAEWLGLESGGSVDVNTDFETTFLDPALLRELREAVAAGQLDLETWLRILERGEILPDDVDVPTIIARIEAGAGMPAAQRDDSEREAE